MKAIYCPSLEAFTHLIDFFLVQLLLARKDCPRYYEARDRVFQSPEVLQIFKDNDILFKQLTEITGMKIENPDDVQSLYSTLKAEASSGKTHKHQITYTQKSILLQYCTCIQVSLSVNQLFARCYRTTEISLIISTFILYSISFSYSKVK